MLDKSIPYKNIIMRLEADRLPYIGKPALPQGFTFRHFVGEQCVRDWAGIEASVLEFSSESEAEEYFTRAYLPHIDEIRRRCIFVCNPAGTPVATAMAWYVDSELGYQSRLDWVSARPEYQGLGIGKAIVQRCLELAAALDPGQPVWLHTQTWSHKAVLLYHRLGFNALKSDRLANQNTRDGVPKVYANDYHQAMDVLKTVLDDAATHSLTDSAV